MSSTIKIKVNPEDFNLKQIFECGQCFRWERYTETGFELHPYMGTAGGRVAVLGLEGDELTVEELITKDSPKGNAESSEVFWREYLDLDRDYGAIKKQIAAGSGVMEEVISYGKGIRILRQDPWEATLSFIISQNNNIPRIKKNIRQLSELFGEKIGEHEGTAWYDVPSPEVLAGLTVDDLASVKLGYRARYIIESAQCVMEKGEDVLREDLGSLCGVGPKVANCIRLFGLQEFDSFPVDVWIKRFMTEVLGISDVRKMHEYAEKHFGEYGGIAQQYMFYFMREKGYN